MISARQHIHCSVPSVNRRPAGVYQSKHLKICSKVTGQDPL
ncbi:hypothetical protein PspLS_09884 [Pyricularia sp. CBS 133598]|nr:hypothetical protein PspLS_09884 [Pyricularia sp. CBS 133598]